MIWHFRPWRKGRHVTVTFLALNLKSGLTPSAMSPRGCCKGMDRRAAKSTHFTSIFQGPESHKSGLISWKGRLLLEKLHEPSILLALVTVERQSLSLGCYLKGYLSDSYKRERMVRSVQICAKNARHKFLCRWFCYNNDCLISWLPYFLTKPFTSSHLKIVRWTHLSIYYMVRRTSSSPYWACEWWRQNHQLTFPPKLPFWPPWHGSSWLSRLCCPLLMVV